MERSPEEEPVKSEEEKVKVKVVTEEMYATGIENAKRVLLEGSGTIPSSVRLVTMGNFLYVTGLDRRGTTFCIRPVFVNKEVAPVRSDFSVTSGAIPLTQLRINLKDKTYTYDRDDCISFYRFFDVNT